MMIVLFLWLTVFGCAASGSLAKETHPAVYNYLVSQIESSRRALGLLNQAIEQDPTRSHLWFKRASLKASQGDFQGAEQDARRALEISPDHLESLILMGKIEQSQGKRPEAIGYYQKVISLDPEQEEVTYLLTEVYLGEKRYTDAVHLLEDWSERHPENLQPLFYIASLYQSLLKEPTKAVATYRRILSLDASNGAALSSLASIFLEAGRETEALQALKSLREVAPDDISMQLKIALIYYEAKRYEEAVSTFREILKAHPDVDRVVYYLGVILENVGRGEEALTEFARIANDSSFYKEAMLHRAYLQHRARRDHEATDLLQEALKVQPKEPDLYEYLAELYSLQNRFDEAIGVLKEALKKVGPRESLHYSLGLVYDRAGHYEAGVKAMRTVLKLNPNNANALNYIGYTFADQKRMNKLDEALALIQKALLLKPDDGFFTDSLGWVYFRKGDLEQAYLYIKKAYDLVPEEPTIAEHLGDIFLAKQDPAKALHYFEESLAILEKKDEDAAKDLQRLKEKIEQIRH